MTPRVNRKPRKTPQGCQRRFQPVQPQAPPLSGMAGLAPAVGACVLSPILFFGLLEAGLRLGGYGYPTGFFLGPDAAGTCTTNYRFGWRFFPQ